MFIAVKSDWVESDCCFTLFDITLHSNQGGVGGKAIELGIVGLHIMIGTGI